MSMNTTNHPIENAVDRRLIKWFVRACFLGFPIILFTYIMGCFVPFYFSDYAEKVLVSKMTYISFGLIVGLFQLLLGVLLMLIGITVDYRVNASMGPAKLHVISASPGLLLILCSNFLIIFCLMRSIEVTQITQQTPPQNSSFKGDNIPYIPPPHEKPPDTR